MGPSPNPRKVVSMSKIECKVTVGLLLQKEDKVLLIKRKNTDYENGNYAFPCGHVEEHESLKRAMVRETKEEIGINIKEEDLTFLTVMFKKADKKYVNFFFKCSHYEEEPINAEPDKCEEVNWFQIEKLPENMAKMEERIIYDYKNNINFDEYGW